MNLPISIVQDAAQFHCLQSTPQIFQSLIKCNNGQMNISHTMAEMVCNTGLGIATLFLCKED